MHRINFLCKKKHVDQQMRAADIVAGMLLSSVLFFMIRYMAFFQRRLYSNLHKPQLTTINNCQFTVLLPTMKRSNIGFEYIYRTIVALDSVRTRAIDPCIHVYHMRGYDAQSNEHIQALMKPFRVQIHTIFKNASTSNRFSNSGLTARESQQSDDMFDLLSNAKQLCKPNNLFMLMEDDFVLCKDAQYQLLRVMDEARKRWGKFSAYRVSSGLNGILFQCDDIPILLQHLLNNVGTKMPIDWLLENWWAMNQLQDTEFHYYAQTNLSASHQKTYYAYKYQLFHHIGGQSTLAHEGHASQALCNERIIHTGVAKEFDTIKCSNSLFSPCEMHSSLGTADVGAYDDPFHLPQFHPRHTLEQLKRASIEQCHSSCTSCCQGKQKECVPSLLPYINRCDIFKSKWICQQENSWCATAPTVVGSVFYLVSRQSRFSCDASPSREEMRICPCG